MSGLQDKIELARKNGYSDAEIVQHLSSTDLAPKIKQAQEAGYGEAEIIGHLAKPSDKPKREFNDLERTVLGLPPKRSTMSEVGRQVGLTARYGIEGLSAPINMAGDAVGLQSTKAVSNFLTKLGLPQPEGAQERVVGDVTRAMAGQGGFMKVGQLMSGAAAPVVGRVGDLMAANAGSQVIGAAGSAGASGTTREAGGGTVAQMIAGLAGGVAAPIAGDVAVTAGKAVGRGARALIDPFTQAGKERVVGATLNRLATDPKSAAANLENAAETIPGSRPTTAQAARDEGLLIAERGVSSSNPQAGARMARRDSEQNQARTILMKGMAGDDQAISAAESARDATTSASREAAFDGAKGPVDFNPVVERLKAISASPEGGRVESERALKWLSDRLAKYESEGRTDARNAYELQKDIGNLVSGKVTDEKGAIKLAGVLANQIKKTLTEQIEQQAPGFKGYLADYAKQSKPINQMEVLQDVQGKVLNAGTDAATGERLMSSAKFFNAVTKNKSELSKVLSKEQMANLEAIGRDLDSAALSSSSGKAAGSNTTQNLSTAYVIGAALGNKASTNGIVQNLSRPISWLNKLNEQQVQDLLVDAMLEPGLAKSLMSKATPRALESLGFELQQRAIAKGLGGLIGTSATAGQNRQAEPAKQ